MSCYLIAGCHRNRGMVGCLHNISQSTFYNWRSKYGGMDATLISRLKELEVENARLKGNPPKLKTPNK